LNQLVKARTFSEIGRDAVGAQRGTGSQLRPSTFRAPDRAINHIRIVINLKTGWAVGLTPTAPSSPAPTKRTDIAPSRHGGNFSGIVLAKVGCTKFARACSRTTASGEFYEATSVREWREAEPAFRDCANYRSWPMLSKKSKIERRQKSRKW
jgi:hypothetical protein